MQLRNNIAIFQTQMITADSLLKLLLNKMDPGNKGFYNVRLNERPNGFQLAIYIMSTILVFLNVIFLPCISLSLMQFFFSCLNLLPLTYRCKILQRYEEIA